MNTDERYLERFIVRPSSRLFGGIEVKEDMKFEVENNDGSVIQKFENGKLTTLVSKEETNSYRGQEVKTCYTQSIIQDVPVGTILLWSEETGYIIPEYNMVRVNEAIEQLEVLKEVISDDLRRDEKKGSDTN